MSHEEEYQSEYHRLHCLDNVCPGLLRLGGGAVREMEDPANKGHLSNSHGYQLDTTDGECSGSNRNKQTEKSTRSTWFQSYAE